MLSWARAERKTLAMVTLTVSHSKQQSLREVWDVVTGAWGDVTAGAKWGSESAAEHEQRVAAWWAKGQEHEADRMAGLTAKTGATRAPRGWHQGREPERTIGLMEEHGCLGWAKATETTHGTNGWHTHIHAVLVFDAADSRGSTAASLMGAAMGNRWLKAVKRRGFTASHTHGYDIKIAESAQKKLAEYLTKMGSADDAAEREQIIADMGKDARGLGAEATLGAMKKARGKSRTPFQILEDAVTTGDMDDIEIWREWVRESAGRHFMTWSRGLRKLAGLAAEEETDEEIAAEETGSDEDTILILPAQTWRKVHHEAEHLLTATEQRGLDGARSWLDARRLSYAVVVHGDESAQAA